MTAHDKLVAQIRQEMARKSTPELMEIWVGNNHQIWTDDAFEAIGQELLARGENLPEQEPAQVLLKGVATWTPAAMRGDLRKWGIFTILLGLIDFFAIGEVYHIPGILLVILGISNFFLNNPAMYLLDCLCFLGFAVVNLLFGKSLGIYFAVVQFIWAFWFYMKFTWYRTATEKQEEMLVRLGRKPGKGTQ